MTEMIENRKGEKKHDRIDLFSILLEAYESGETEFTKKELLSKIKKSLDMLMIQDELLLSL